MASADVALLSDVTPAFDVPRIATFLQLPQKTIESLSAVGESFISNVLTALTERARDYGELQANKMRVDVELEQNTRTANARNTSMKSRLDAALAETQELRKKALEAETVKAHLEADMANMKNSNASNDEESRTLRARVTTLESEKREIWEALERKNSAYDRLQEDYQQVQTKIIELRKETNTLESRLQQAESNQSAGKFREQKLKQELEIAKKNGEWLDGEFNAKTAELSKFRKEKNAQVNKLQHDFEEERSKANMAERNVEVIKGHYEEVSRKLGEAQVKIKDLNDKASTQEDAFRAEMASAQRLAELWEKSTNSARNRVKQVEEILENERGAQADEIGRVQAMCDALREESAHANNRVEELEVQIERLEADLATYASQAMMSVPGSPAHGRRSFNGRPMTPQRGRTATPERGFFSPAAQAIAQSQKSGLSLTQMYTDYTNMKRELDVANSRNSRLQESFDELIQELESKVPEFDQQKEDLDRATQEILGMSEILQEANQAKDASVKEAAGLRRKVKEQKAEAVVLKQQLRDISAQVQLLLSEVQHLEQGLPPLTTADQIRFKKLALQGAGLNVADTDTDRIINQRLVLFFNIKELQETNAELLKVVRQLGLKAEQDEEKRRLEAEGQKTREVLELSQTLETYRDEIRGLQQRAESFIKERDMFRRMLQNRGEAAQDQSLIEQGDISMRESQATVVADTHDNEDYAQLLRELQQSFDSYRQEAATDHTTLREQGKVLQAEKNDLQIQITRVNGQLELANARYEMLNANFDMLRSENSELQKRNQTLSEMQAKLDLRSQQVEEELVDTKSLNESMRSENAHLKAEKQLFKSIEERLTRDNENLLDERSKLNGAISSLQSMQNERERAEGENRRRHDQQISNLESELQGTKRRLTDEIEESKKALMRRELDTKEAQRKIDEVNAALAATREGLIAAKTTQDHLQGRVDELQILLKASEEKLAVLQPAETATKAALEEDSPSLEQELRIEIADLTRNLELTQADLETAKSNVEQYKQISQSSEDALQSLSETHDAYKEDTDRQIEERDARIKDLEQRMADITAEMDTTNAELTRLRQAQAEHQHVVDEQEKTHEDKVKSLQAEIDNLIYARTEASTNVKRQADIAKDAQNNYEQELMKHAHAAEQLQNLRNEHAELKNQVYGFKAQAEAATTTLESSMSSWELQRDTYEKELREIRSRCDDLVKQNKLLHGQFEGVSMQISSLQKTRNLADGELEIANSDKSLEELREVIAYLRREKEIVDVQLELQTQESRRFKQQLEHTRTSLDEVRTLLQEERLRENEALRGIAQHEDLMQRISELNLLRESNSALRTEKERLHKKLQEAQEKIEAMTILVEPMEDRISELEGQVLVKDGQIKLLEEDNERWKTRTQQILQKYDRIDPVELENLKAELKSVQEKHAEAVATLDERDGDILDKNFEIAAKVKENEELGKLWKAKYEKVVNQAKEKQRSQIAIIAERNTTIEQLNTEIQELRTSLEAAKSAETPAVVGHLEEERSQLQAQLAALEEKASSREMGQNANMEAFLLENNNLKALLADTQQQVANLQSQLAAIPTNGEAQDIEAIVAQRVTQQLAQTPSSIQDQATIDAMIQEAVAAAQAKAAEDKAKLRESYQNAVRKRIDEVRASKDKEVEAEKEVSAALQAQIEQLQAMGTSEGGDTAKDQEIQSLRQTKANLEAQLEQRMIFATSETGDQELQSLREAKANAEAQIEQLKIVAISTPDIAAKDQEIEALKNAKAEADLKIERLQGSSANVDESDLQRQLTEAQKKAADLQAELATKPTQEDFKRIISKNVQARVTAAKEKMEKEKEEEIQKIKEGLAMEVNQAKTIQAAELQAQYDAEKATKEEDVKAQLSAATEAGRLLAEKKTSVMVSMRDNQIKALQKKVKQLEGGEIHAQTHQAATTPSKPVTTSQPAPAQTPIQNPFAAVVQQQPVVSAFGQPQTIPAVSAFGQPQTTPAASAFGSQQQFVASPVFVPQVQSDAQSVNQNVNVGTGPAALRSLRGNLQSGIPKPGGGGRGGKQQPQSSIPNVAQTIPADVLQQRQQRFGLPAPPPPPPPQQQQEQQLLLQQPNVQIQGQFQNTRGGANNRGRGGGGRGNSRQSQDGQNINTNIPSFTQPQLQVASPGLRPDAKQFLPTTGLPLAVTGKRERVDSDIVKSDDTKRQRTPNESSNP